MLLVYARFHEELVGDFGVENGLAAGHRPLDAARLLGPRRVPRLNLRGERHLRRIDVLDREPLHRVVAFAHDVHRAPVGQRGHREARYLAERGLVVERLREGGRGVDEEGAAGLLPLLVPHVAEDEDGTGDLAVLAADGRPAVVDGDVAPVARNQHRVIRQAYDRPVLEYLLHGAGDDLARALVLDVEDLRQRAPNGIRLGVAGERAGHRVHDRDPPGGVGGDDRVPDAVEGGGQLCPQLLREPQRGALELEPARAEERLGALARERLHEGALLGREGPGRVEAHAQESDGAALGRERDAPEGVCARRPRRGDLRKGREVRDVRLPRFHKHGLPARQRAVDGVPGRRGDAPDLLDNGRAASSFADELQRGRALVERVERARVGVRAMRAVFHDHPRDVSHREGSREGLGERPERLYARPCFDLAGVGMRPVERLRRLLGHGQEERALLGREVARPIEAKRHHREHLGVEHQRQRSLASAGTSAVCGGEEWGRRVGRLEPFGLRRQVRRLDWRGQIGGDAPR